ncbi:MAG: glycosyltransferase family 4 protein [Acidobacteriota bacterium]
MRIAYIAAGAADMYCGSCIHDNTLAAALQKKGHEVALLPTYTPLRTDEPNVSMDHIFYGGINVYLQQKFALFRHTPWVLDSLFDRPILLNLVSQFSSTTNARDLGALTASVLKGERGHHQKELLKLVRWLKDSVKPEIVQLTNSMFVGLTRQIKQELQVPVLCALQGEDIFLQDLLEPYKSQVLELLRKRVPDVDGFIATSEYYADFMSQYLDIAREKIHVVRWGLNLQGYGKLAKNTGKNSFAIGYLARICPEKGLHLLVEAFHRLSERPNPDQLQLKVAGYLSKRDRPYFNCILQKISKWGLEDRFDYWGEVDRQQKIQFLNTLHVLSVPTTYREPKGLYVLEALANGVPVVEPRHGSFPELIQATGGGVLVNPDSVGALVEGIQSLVEDSEHRDRLARQGKEAVHRAFSDEMMAEATLAVYRQYVA